MLCQALTKRMHFCKNKTKSVYCKDHEKYTINKNDTWFHDLPVELFEEITKHFTYQEYYKLATTSKSLYYLLQPFFRNINTLKILINRDFNLITSTIVNYIHPFTPICITYWYPPVANHLVIQLIYKHTLYTPIIKIHNKLDDSILLFNEPCAIPDDIYIVNKTLKNLIQDWKWLSHVTIDVNYTFSRRDKKLFKSLKYPIEYGNVTYTVN